jgi:hypothetical protein
LPPYLPVYPIYGIKYVSDQGEETGWYQEALKTEREGVTSIEFVHNNRL